MTIFSRISYILLSVIYRARACPYLRYERERKKKACTAWLNQHGGAYREASTMTLIIIAFAGQTLYIALHGYRLVTLTSWPTMHALTRHGSVFVHVCIREERGGREKVKIKKTTTSASFILTYTDILFIYHNSSFVKISFLETINGHIRSCLNRQRSKGNY